MAAVLKYFTTFFIFAGEFSKESLLLFFTEGGSLLFLFFFSPALSFCVSLSLECSVRGFVEVPVDDNWREEGGCSSFEEVVFVFVGAVVLVLGLVEIPEVLPAISKGGGL